MNKTIAVTLIIVLLFIIIGCDSETPISIPTSFASPPRPILTASPTITLTPSPTLSPNDATEKAKFEYYQQTQVYIKQTMIPGTLEARGVRCKDGFYPEQYLDIWYEANDEWTLFTCSPLPKISNGQWTPGLIDYSTRYTQVVKNDLSQVWTIKHGDYVDLGYNIPDVLMRVYRWTKNGKYLYIYPRTYFYSLDGYSLSSMLRTVLISKLYRLNLVTGEFELVLDKSQFGAFALSPNDQFLIYSENDESDIIHVRNMENGDDQQIKLDEEIVAAGSFAWNAESTKVVFALGYGKESDDWQDDLSATSIVVLTLKNMHIQTILSKDSRIFTPWSHGGCADGYWVDENTLCLYANNKEFEGIFSINIHSGTVLKVYPTHTPKP